MKVKTRIAPSPTGSLHVGTARTALYNWLYARQQKGKFVLRIEDTDRERSEKKFEDDILEGLKWLGLEWDEMYRQSERLDIYKSYAEKLIEESKAYKEGSAVILKRTLDKINFEDLVRGKIGFDMSDTKDQPLIKSDGTPTYHFAVVIDDHEMRITHVIRGEDHVTNTATQMSIAHALNFYSPTYAHLPLILGSDRSKLSKRHGALSVNDYRKRGYLPEALINFMALLGWNPGDEREIIPVEDLIKEFSLEKVHKGGAVFNIGKLNWMNQQYIQKMDPPELKNRLEAHTGKKISDQLVKLARTRLKTLSDILEDLAWLEEPKYDGGLLAWKDTPTDTTKQNLEAALKIVEDVRDSDFNEKTLEKKLRQLANKKGRGEVLWPLRVALSGEEKSPGPFELAELVGKKETIKRIGVAIGKLN